MSESIKQRFTKTQAGPFLGNGHTSTNRLLIHPSQIKMTYTRRGPPNPCASENPKQRKQINKQNGGIKSLSARIIVSTQLMGTNASDETASLLVSYVPNETRFSSDTLTRTTIPQCRKGLRRPVIWRHLPHDKISFQRVVDGVPLTETTSFVFLILPSVFDRLAAQFLQRSLRHDLSRYSTTEHQLVWRKEVTLWTESLIRLVADATFLVHEVGDAVKNSLQPPHSPHSRGFPRRGPVSPHRRRDGGEVGVGSERLNRLRVNPSHKRSGSLGVR